MANRDDELKALRELVTALTTVVAVYGKQLRDITAREAVLRSLVQQSRPVSQQVYDAMYTDALRQFDEKCQVVIAEATELHRSAALLRLLESHDSKPQ